MMFLLFLIVGVAVADKLDRRYLPPPTENLSGGNAEIIGLPFEETTSKNYLENELKPSNVALGIDRVSQKESLDNNKNEYSILNDSFSRPETATTKSVTHPIHLYDNNDQDIYRHTTENSFDSLIPYKHKDENKGNIYNKSSKFSLTDTFRKRIQDERDKNGVVINFDNIRTPEGYAYSYDTSNNIHADESAVTLNGVKAKGSYSYLGDDGKLYTVNYTADENGFRPQGDHIPTSPPIPSAILKVIEQAYKDKEAGKFDDGSYNDNKYGYRKYQKTLYNRNGFPSIMKTVKFTKNTEDPMNYFTAMTDRINTGNQNNEQTSQYASNPYKILNKLKMKPIQQIEDSRNDIQDKTDDKPYQDIKETLNTLNNMNKQINIPSGHQSHQQSTPKYLPEDFTTRFSDYVHKFTEKTKEMSETTRKPFLTPYVTHNDENELTGYEYPESPFDDLVNQYKVIHNDKYSDHDFIPHNKQNNKVQLPDETDSYDNFLVPGGEGYFYGMKLKDLDHSIKQPFASHILPSASSQFQTIPVKNIPSSDPNIYTKLNALLGNTTLRSAFVDETERYIPIFDEGSLNSKNAIKSNKGLPQIKISEEIPRIGTTLSPYINIDPDDTDKNFKKYISEDFSGPEQPQNFDAATGYYY